MTNAEARCNKSLRPRKPEGSLGRTAQDVHLDSHTAPELCPPSLPLMSHLCARQACRSCPIYVPAKLPAHVTVMCPPGLPLMSQSCAHQACRSCHSHVPTRLAAHVTVMCPPGLPLMSQSCAHQACRSCHSHVPKSGVGGWGGGGVRACVCLRVVCVEF